MDQQNPTLAKIPILDIGKFEQWQFRIQQYLQHEHCALWEVIEFGDSYKVPKDVTTGSASDGTGKNKGRTVTLTTDDMQKRKNDVKARSTLLLALPDEHQLRFSKHKTTQELWAAILKTFSDDLYNHLKVYESEVQKKSESNSQNMAFISLAKHSSGNEKVNIASVSTASTNVSTASANIGVATISQDTACAYIASQSSGKKISIQGTDVAGFDKSKDWSYMANDKENHALVANEEDHTEFALMAKTSAESEVFDNSLCSKACKKNTNSLNSKIIDLDDKLGDAKNMIYHYKLGLAQVEARLVEHRNQEVKYCKKIRDLEFKTESRANCIETLTKDLELLKKEKGELETKLTSFQTASKDLDSLLECQRLDKNKEGLGYSAVPPPHAQVYSPPKKDLSWIGLPEFADDTVTNYSRLAPTIESSPNDAQNRNPSITVTEASPSTISPKSFIKFVKATNRSTETNTTKVKTAKPTIKYVTMYNKPSKSSKVGGNQRNWNNLKSHQLGANFVMKKKACYNCGDFDHLAYDCGVGVKKGKTCPTNSYKTILPRTVIHKPYRPPMRPMRPNINVAQPNRTSFYKPAHSYTKRHFQRTSAVRSQYKGPRVPPVSRKFFTVNRKFLNANRKFPTSSRKFSTADMGKNGKAVKSSACYWDSGCSRHMTGNISYLSDYDPFDEGYVSFGQRGCKITGKGTIKSECIVLGRNFKLSDDANVLLRTPRQHNMYSIDLNNIVLHQDLTCLVAKASVDECMFWHRRLGKQHKASCKSKLVNSVTKPLHTLHMDLFGPTSDETSGIHRKFITEIENLKELKVKIIRILIEAARTMLADAKLPVTFWAEAVNTGCYIQNRVLVNKSQNKTPYELFNGRTPAIGFLKPFGCHVIILNALDNLGKFEAKGDEGYFIGYSMSSKAFRVINKRTKRVEENLHVDFLENKAIGKGAGLNWLFDIDSLTKSINYVPVAVAGTNSTNFSGTKDSAGQEVKKDVSSLRYIALPNWVYDALLESSSSKPHDDCSIDGPESSGNSNPTTTSTNPPADQMETLTVETTIPTIIGHVDTLIQTREFEALMHEKFQMSAMGELNFFLGLQVLQKEDGIFLSQDKYVGDILKKFGYPDVRSSSTPMDKENPWGKEGTGKDVDLHLYRSMIGSLMYLTASRPDIMFAGHPKLRLTQIVIMVVLLKIANQLLEGVSFLGRRLISWQCKKQTIVATSTTKAEYVAAASCYEQVLWTQNQLLDYGDCFEKKLISMDHIYTDKNVADVLTKPFDVGRFQYLVNQDFHQIVDFVEASHIRYALTFNPTVYVSHIRKFWSTARIETTEEGTKILATVDGKLRTISESSIRRNLKLNDEVGISSVPDVKLFKNLQLMGYNILPNQKFTFQKGQFSHQWKYLIHTIMQCLSPKSTRFNEFSRNIAAALVCLATNRVYNFSKMIFDDEPTSPLGDDSQGEACPIDSCFEADQDRANIAKTSTLPSDSTPRVTSLAANEGSMQKKLDELMALCTSLQRSQSKMVSRFEAQELEINSLKARIKLLEDKDRGVVDQSRDDAPIKGRRLDKGQEAAERVSDDTGEMETVLTSMDAASILTSGGVQLVPTAAEVATATKRKRKMVESDTPKKKKLQEEIDVQVARELEEQMAREDQRMSEQIARDAKVARIHAEEEQQMMINSLDRSNETVAKYLQEYEQIPKDQSIRERIELISDLIEDFIPMGSKEETERFKRKGLRLEQVSAKKLKTSEEVPEEVKATEEVPEEKVKEMKQLVPVEEISQGWEQLSQLPILYGYVDKEDLNQLWRLVKESLSIRPAASDKEIELWLEHQVWGRIVRNKMHKAFSLPVMEFPLSDEVPTANEESSHCQKKRDATVVKICTTTKVKQ
nr:hypothetical protein [Tanacetum cinerariifolium]